MRSGVAACAGEVEKVFDAAVIDLNLQVDVVADGVRRTCRGGGKDADDLAPGRDMGVTQGGVDGIEPRIAIGAVDDGVKAGLQVHRIAEVREAEVGRVGLAVDGEVAQSALVVAGGAEVAGDAFEVAEVGVVEAVIADDGRLAGIRYLPGTEGSLGVDCLRRDCGLVSSASKCMAALGVNVGDAETLRCRSPAAACRACWFRESDVRVGAVDAAELKLGWVQSV